MGAWMEEDPSFSLRGSPTAIPPCLTQCLDVWQGWQTWQPGAQMGSPTYVAEPPVSQRVGALVQPERLQQILWVLMGVIQVVSPQGQVVVQVRSSDGQTTVCLRITDSAPDLGHVLHRASISPLLPLLASGELRTLAWARQLARSMRGSLICLPHDGGASLVLSFPAAEIRRRRRKPPTAPLPTPTAPPAGRKR